MIIKTTASLVAAALLVACATRAERTASNIRAVAEVSNAETRACVANAAVGHDDLAVHMPLDGTGATLLQQADESLITPGDARSLGVWHAALQKCREARLRAITPVAANVADANAAGFLKADQVYLALLQRKLTWGAANRELAAVRAEAQHNILAATSRLNAELQQADAAEREQRAAAVAAIGQAVAAASQAAQQQQLINSLNRPVTTNCNRLGSTVNCVSY
jgi:hypothetical protein